MVVLGTKVYVTGESRRRARDALSSLLVNAFGDLDVEYTLGIRDDGFPSVTVSGTDAAVARSVLAEEWGVITPHREAGEMYVGTLEAWDEEGVVLDAGEPVRVAAADLGLGPGSPGQIRKRFGLVQHLPLRFVEGDDETPTRLADEEQDRLYEWTRDTGRVNANSVTRGQARATVNRAGHAEDIITIERVGLLEQSIVCHSDTDPPGLLADIGPYLEAELLAVVP